MAKNGGKRKGAGRKSGGQTRETKKFQRKLADLVVTDGGITPLEVMITTMRYHWDSAENAETDAEQAAALELASAHAERAAPYIHHRLSSTQVGGADNGKPIAIMIVDSIDDPVPVKPGKAARPKDTDNA